MKLQAPNNRRQVYTVFDGDEGMVAVVGSITKAWRLTEHLLSEPMTIEDLPATRRKFGHDLKNYWIVTVEGPEGSERWIRVESWDLL